MISTSCKCSKTTRSSVLICRENLYISGELCMPPLCIHSRYRRTIIGLVSVFAICLVACTSRAGTATGKATATTVVKPTASATAAPIATATPRPDPIAAYAHYYVDQMSLDAKIGQLLYAQSYSGGIYQ